MAGIAEVKRIQNDESIKFIPSTEHVEISSDGQDFTAFFSQGASCATGDKFNAEYLSDPRVWFEITSENIYIHGPKCLFPHDENQIDLSIPKAWKKKLEMTACNAMAVPIYQPNEHLESTMHGTLVHYLKSGELDNAYDEFLRLLPRIVSTQPFTAIEQLANSIDLTTKATMAIGLFWLGMQTKQDRCEVAEKSFAMGLEILEDFEITPAYALPLRAAAHLASIYQIQEKREKEIELRSRLVRHLQVHDDALYHQLSRLLELNPNIDLASLGIQSEFPEKLLVCLAQYYQREEIFDKEAAMRIRRLQKYHSPTSCVTLCEMASILQADPNRDPYTIFPDTIYPPEVLLSIAKTYKDQTNETGEIKARVKLLCQHIEPETQAFTDQIDLILEIDPTFDPHSIYSQPLPRCALVHLADVYRNKKMMAKEIAMRCRIIEQYDQMQTSFEILERLFTLDPGLDCFKLFHPEKQMRHAIAKALCKKCKQHRRWSWAHILARYLFSEADNDLQLADKMLTYACTANESENVIAAFKHLLRLAPSPENIEKFQAYCQAPNLPQSAHEQLLNLPEVADLLVHSNHLLTSAKILEEILPQEAENLVKKAVWHCTTNHAAHQHLYILFEKRSKVQESVDILVRVATNLRHTQEHAVCCQLIEFLIQKEAHHDTLGPLADKLPDMQAIAKLKAENRDLKKALEDLKTRIENFPSPRSIDLESLTWTKLPTPRD